MQLIKPQFITGIALYALSRNTESILTPLIGMNVNSLACMCSINHPRGVKLDVASVFTLATVVYIYSKN